ncbi:hypothetical protein FS842_001541 [Serendipita sp. 407]|nr:hypothetical protein FS842_001541 [Serendipita sp. 407]
MAPVLSLLSTLTLLSTVIHSVHGYNINDPKQLLRRDGEVDTSEQLLPFIDYEAISEAADIAVSEELQRRGLLDAEEVNAKRSNSPRCSKINVRKEWRKLSTSEKKSYIKAVKCLTTKSDFGISTYSDKMYDAFTYIHEQNWFLFHGCATFPVWHRWFVWLREVTMREQCGYTGPFPYWNYTMDWKDPFASPIFSSDSETGFGSHGNVAVAEIAGATGYKVDNGAFANFRVNLPEPHFLTRNFTFWKESDPTGQYGKAFGKWFGPEQLQKTLAANTFWDFEKLMDGLEAPQSLGIHNGPHFNQNGDWSGPAWLVNNPTYYPWRSTAPNDPMFFPHHAYVDAVFWQWQQRPGKQYLYGGSTDIFNLTKNDAKITDMLPFSGFGPDVPVALTLKTESFPLCYTYDV